MNDQILQDILRRLARIEATAVRYRAGEVTDVAPLDVALGGSDVSYEDVKAVGPVGDGDQVAALLWGNDLLVLGALGAGWRFGGVTITWPGATTLSDAMTVPHGLGVTPRTVVATANDASLSVGVTSTDATNIVIRCQEVNGTIKGAGPFGFVRWLALG